MRGPCLGGDRGAIGFHQSAILACEAFTQPINDRGQVMTRKNQNLGKVFGDRPRRSTCNTHLRSQDAASARRIYFDAADKSRASSDNPTQGLGMPASAGDTND